MSAPGKRPGPVEVVIVTVLGVLALVLKARAIGTSPWELVVGFFVFLGAVVLVANLVTWGKTRRSSRSKDTDDISPGSP
jgi:F0F1-type ATP synthase assembly protein I